MNPPGTTRRDFLQSGAAATAALSLATVLPEAVLGRDKTAASEKITLGVIGIGLLTRAEQPQKFATGPKWFGPHRHAILSGRTHR